MAKKEKSKKRLDKFYHIAKEQGYRSRAAFKLIQLNKKYNFLQSANVLVDLCAAPGGWMQVASKYMTSNSIIIGVDLDPIKPVPNCKSFIEDITTAKCLATIRRELQGAKVDVVLNDGAPNVGANWNRDAYVQAELVLASLKVACELLRKGGVFVTKVFRSADYHALIWVMSKFFEKVEATKPEASRAISAEIFVVGLNFKAPDYIDKKFFDPRSVFQDNEASLAEILSTKEVNSVDKVFEIRNRRHKTVTDSTTQTTHRPLTLEQFVEMEMPYAAFVEFSRIDVRPEDREKYFSHLKFGAELEESCKDLLILGKREIFGLVKWRNRIRATLHKQRKAKFEKIEYDEPEEEEDDEEDPGQELYKLREKERRAQEKLKEKQLLNYAKKNSTGTNAMVVPNELEAELQDFDFDRYGEIIRKGEIIDRTAEENAAHAEYLKQFGGKYHEYKKRDKALNSEQEVIDNLEYLYERKRARVAQDEEKRAAREQEKRERKERHLRNRGDESEEEEETNGGKMDRLESDTVLKKRALMPEAAAPDRDDLRKGSKWFDRGIFDILDSVREEQRAASEKPQKKLMTSRTPMKPIQVAEEASEGESGEEEFFDDEEGDEEFGDEEFEDDEELEEGADEDGSEDAEEDDESGDEEDDDRADSEEAELPGLKKKAKRPIEVAQVQPKKKAPAVFESTHDQDYEIQAELPDEEEQMADMEQEKITKKDIKRLNRIKGEMAAEAGIEQENADDLQFTEYDNRHTKELTPRQKNLITIKDKKEKRGGPKGIDGGKIEVVPSKKFEDFDTEELAEDLALAKKMLRKKDREAILDMSFNKHNNFDYEGLPSWFVEDERKHHYLNLPITKEEVRAVKEEIRTINERPAKKVMEAKIRKKKRLEKQLKKFKKRADAVFEDEGLDERSKGREVIKLKSKIVTANKNTKQKKKTIVSKSFKSGAPSSRKTSGKKYQMVDSRSKKEVRAMKRIKRQGKNYKAKGKRY